MRYFLNLLILSCCFLLISCTDDDPSFMSSEQVIISDSELDSAPRDALEIQSLSIDGDRLTIRFSASGCNGDSWKVRLIGSEFVLEPIPPIRAMLLSLDNDEDCEALITREVTFDITPTQTSSPSTWLDFIDTDHRILYEYN